MHLLRRAAAAAATAEGFRDGDLSIAVLGARAMGALHQRTLGLSAPTDVLTFDLGVDRRRRWIEGEIVICRDVAERVCRRGGAASPGEVARELALYVVHGVMHLAGYDDHDPREAAAMHRREDEILTALGVGPRYTSAETTNVSRPTRGAAK